MQTIDIWKKEMAMAVRRQRVADRYAVDELHNELNRIAGVHLASGRMEEGNRFLVKTENGDRLEFQFYKDGSAVTCYGTSGKSELVIRDENGEWDTSGLSLYKEEMREKKAGLGAPYPAGLPVKLTSLSLGELIVFGNGKSYACMAKEDRAVSLKPTCRATDLNVSSFMEVFRSYRQMRLELENGNEMQAFWNRVRDAAEDDLVARITSTTAAQETINRCTGSLSAGQTKKMDFGVVSFRVKRPRVGKQFVWYGEDGKTIEELNVKLVICWLNAAPVITDFKRPDANAVHAFNDGLIKSALNQLYAKGEYAKAYEMLSRYCSENHGMLKVSMKTYVRDKGEKFVGQSVVFSEDGAYRLTFPDGNFTKDAASVERIGEQEFISFCEKKFDASFLSLKNEKMAEIREQYKNAPEKVAEKVAETAAKRQMAAEVPDFGVDIAEADVSSLIGSFAETSVSGRIAQAAELAAEAKREAGPKEHGAAEPVL